MAKDDYEVILYRLLVYLYACKKRKILYEEKTFQESVQKNVENDQYFIDIIEMAQSEGLICGAVFTKAWGNVKIPLFRYDELEITAEGIRYLKENSTMEKIGGALKEAVDIISPLASLVGLF